MAGVAIGIVAVIGERDRSTTRPSPAASCPRELSFTAEAREYRVFVVSGNAESDSARTACQTSTGADFNGSNQGVRSRSATPRRSGPSTAPAR